MMVSLAELGVSVHHVLERMKQRPKWRHSVSTFLYVPNTSKDDEGKKFYWRFLIRARKSADDAQMCDQAAEQMSLLMSTL